MSYASIILQEFPPESQAGMLKFAEAIEENLREQFAVRRSDVDDLRVEIRELTAAQIRSERRMGGIETAIEALTAAQTRTEREIHSLIGTVETLVDEHKETRRQLGGLTMTVGYQLEDLAYPALPALLKRDYNLILDAPLKRCYVNDGSGQPREINILGTAKRNGTQVTIVGGSKAQLSKNDVDRFLRRTVQKLAGVYDTLFPVLVTYMISERDVEAYARERNVALYYSYGF